MTEALASTGIIPRTRNDQFANIGAQVLPKVEVDGLTVFTVDDCQSGIPSLAAQDHTGPNQCTKPTWP